MKHTRLIAAAALACGLLVGSTTIRDVPRASAATTPICGAVTKAPTYKHVVVIVMENHSYGSIIGSSSAPFINSLAKSCGLATNYHSVTHNSLPNYLALTSGMALKQLMPFTGDCNPSPSCTTGGSLTVFHQTYSKSYEEWMRYNCELSDDLRYAVRHNPMAYYKGIGCASRDISFDPSPKGWNPLLWNFQKESTAPHYAFVTPDLCSDMHDCNIATGDTWLKEVVSEITSTPVYRSHDTAIFIVWDEGLGGGYVGENCAANPSDQSCHVALLVVAPSVKPGTRDKAWLTHYSTLRAAENLLGLQVYGEAKSAPSMLPAFNLGAQ
jgi:phospholipase C